MFHVSIAPARQTDADELIQANLENRDYHAPWVQPFHDLAGFETWFGQLLTGPNFSFVARNTISGAIVGVINLSQIVWGGFRSAYLGYYGMREFVGQGFMTHAVERSATYAFQELGLPSGSKYSARERRFHFIGPPNRLRQRGFFAELPENRWRLVRP